MEGQYVPQKLVLRAADELAAAAWVEILRWQASAASEKEAKQVVEFGGASKEHEEAARDLQRQRQRY